MRSLTYLVLGLLVLSIVPGVFAVSIGSGVTPDITTEKFAPLVWMCDNRVVTDDNTEPGRISDGGQPLVERINNYAFEGEKIHWTVLVMDKNGADKIKDVFATIGSTQGAGNSIEANCQRVTTGNLIEGNRLPRYCNARISEENLTTFDPNTMSFYECTLTVETPQSMYGEHWVTVEAQDLDDLSGTMAENEFWFFNPIISLSIDGALTFDNVRPGTSSYSSTLLVGNNADAGSGVLMDMFISGTDFYDSASSGAKCPTTNQLSLSAFKYFATNGAYSTSRLSGSDAEGYRAIGYATSFNNPNPFYNAYEILPGPTSVGGYYPANVLAPGAEMSVTFRLDMPEPCNGDFNTGSINFWGEAI